MKTVNEFKELCKRRLVKNLNSYLQAPGAVEIHMGLKPPSEAEAICNLEGVKSWIAELKRASRKEPALTIEWQEKHWRRLGAQELPIKISISGLGNIAHFCSWENELHCLQMRAFDLSKLVHKEAEVASASALGISADLSRTLLNLPEQDWKRTLDMASWLLQQKSWDIYARTIPVSGLDTKWFERHYSLVQSICSYVEQERSSHSRTFDFRKAPTLYHLRFLDAAYAPKTPTDKPLINVALSIEDINSLYFKEESLPNVIIVENKASFLALPCLSHCIAIWGEGFKVSGLHAVT